MSKVAALVKKIKNSQDPKVVGETDPNAYKNKVNNEKGKFEQIKNTEEVETNKTGVGTDDIKIDFKKPYNNTQTKKSKEDDLKKILQRG